MWTTGEIATWLKGWFWANAQTIAAIMTIIGIGIGAIVESWRLSARVARLRSQPVDAAKEPKGRPAQPHQPITIEVQGDAKEKPGYRFVAGGVDEGGIILGPGHNLIALRKKNGVDLTPKLVRLSDVKVGTYGFSESKHVTKEEGHPFPWDSIWPEPSKYHDVEVHKAADGKIYLAGYCDPKELGRLMEKRAKGLRAFGLFRNRFKAASKPVAVDCDLIYATNWYQFTGKDEKSFPTYLKIWLLD
jgi:hypothetical protein